MNKEILAVEWLIKELNLEGYDHTIGIAKDMERKQIENAYEEGQKETANGYYIKSGNKYLKDKYK